MQKESKPQFPALSIKNHYYEPEYLQIGFIFTMLNNLPMLSLKIKTKKCAQRLLQKHGSVKIVQISQSWMETCYSKRVNGLITLLVSLLPTTEGFSKSTRMKNLHWSGPTYGWTP